MSSQQLAPKTNAVIKDKLNDVVEFFRKLYRAIRGLPLDEDVYSGLLNIKDIRERTRLSKHEIHRHSYMRLLAKIGGNEWSIMGRAASMEDHYFISKEGLQRWEAILMRQYNLQAQQQAATVNVAIPPMPQQPEPPQKEKKGILRR